LLAGVAAIAGVIITGFVILVQKLFLPEPPDNDAGGWGDDYDPPPTLPVCPEEEKEEDLVCV
jgi:hypothetical protein